MAYEYLDIRRDGPVEYVTLNRPQVRNAFDEQFIDELSRWAAAVADDDTVRVAVLAGAGKAFCAGADLTWMSRMVSYTHEENVRDASAMARMYAALDRLPIPLVGRVHGAALGGGAGLVAICDVVVADEQALFGFTEVKVGIVPAVVSPYVLTKIGMSAARELFLTGKRFNAARAKEIGLVHCVVPADQMDVCVNDYVAELLTAAPEAMATVKELLRKVWGRPVQDTMGLTADAIASRRISAEGQEGMKAFLEKRKPGWVARDQMRRILIANRGEIAVRVIRACRELGIESVAVYSDADARALHVASADRAVRIGPPSAVDSYLSIDAILAAARETEADAIHPGYGFLSENAAFARACDAAGIIFIGPPAEAIDRMGSKIAAREIAVRAGVPVVPGEVPADQSDAAIADAARRIGFPVLLKPSAGGGGIGMKAVHDEAALLPAIAQARREAVASFGDGTIFVERLVERPRHIEFQILADAHGHAVHLFERECSIQRRHQKVLEETPSVAVTPALRERMGDAAVRVAQAAGYRNAGTIEFLVEGTGDAARFYFLEMNTRLQVEHPVTEQVTGVDLVRAQIHVASGEPLPWTQAELSQRGHAIEVRIYAEDPARHDLPQAGPLLLYRAPVMPGIRIDSGVIEGDEIGVHYDPMIAKLIATGETREAARRRALAALRSYPILGIRTNIAFLIALLEHPRVISGDLDTHFLDREGDALRALLVVEPPPEIAAILAAVASAPAASTTTVNADPWSTLRDVRV